MLLKKTFTILVAFVGLSATSVSARSIRGITKESDATKPALHRRLKNQGNQVPAPVQLGPPVTPPPVEPPVLSGVNLCKRDCGARLENCVARSFSASFEACTQCLFAQTTLMSTTIAGINRCSKSFCGGCSGEALDFFNCCGTNPISVPGSVPAQPAPVPNSVPASPVPVPDVVGPTPVVTLAPVAAPVPSPGFTITSTSCPAQATSGDVCTVPVGFDFQQCDYANNIRCTCAYGFFLCNPVPVSPTPRPVASPVAPVPIGTPGEGVCSKTLPETGDTCSTGGDGFVYCCYDTLLNGLPPARPDFAYVCSCLRGENRYLCNAGSKSNCGLIITPETVSAVSPVAQDPVVQDPVVPVTVPEMLTPDIIVPPPANSNIPEFCRNLDGVPQDGTSCADVLPAELSAGACGGEIIIAGADGLPESFTNAICTCEKANPVWACNSMVTTRPPSQATGGITCPPQASPPLTGDSCAGVLAFGFTSGACMFMQTVFMDGAVVSDTTFWCSCDGSTWDCDGVLPPVPPPALMPAGQAQPTSVVPAMPTGMVTTLDCPPKESPPNDKDSCKDFLPAGSTLTNAICTYTSTAVVGGVSETGTKTCTCMAEFMKWSCEGTLPTIPTTLPATGGDMMMPSGGGGGNAVCPPSEALVDGAPCGSFIPAGSQEASCFKTDTVQCNCAGQDNANPTWVCRAV
jgi:hypothetical protein